MSDQNDTSTPACAAHSAKQKRIAIPPALRLEVWETYIGPMTRGLCFVCERSPITIETNVEYGHVVAVANGGTNSVENLRPICSSCNRSMGTQNLLEYKSKLAHMGIGHDPSAERIEIEGIARSASPTIGRALCSASREAQTDDANDPADQHIDRRLFNDLHILTDDQLDLLAEILGVPPKLSKYKRMAIAMRQFSLPRVAHSRSSKRDAARSLISVMDENLIKDIFGIPFAGASALQLRINALWLIGLASKPIREVAVAKPM